MAAFWNGNNFNKKFFKGQKSLYPQLFSFECCNIHTNCKEGTLKKVNFYNGLGDCLQINHTQCPVEKLDIAKKVMDIVAKFPSQDKFVKDLIKIRDESKAKIDTLMTNADDLKITDSAVRAEVRVSLSRAVAFGPLLEHFLNDHFVQANTLVYDMVTIGKLIRFWVYLMFRPILMCLTRLIKQYKELGTEKNPLMRVLPTVSAFESLLTSSFFSGNTYSYLPNFLYAKPKNERHSFELLKAIKKNNKISFSGPLWLDDELRIDGDSRLMDELIAKFKRPDMDKVIETFDIIINMKMSYSTEEAASALWQAYFDHIWKRFPQDFREGTDMREKLKLKSLILNDKVKMAVMTKYNSEQAVKYVFDISRYEKAKERGGDVWTLPHLLAYKEFTDGRREKDKEAIDKALTDIAENLGIEYVHVHGDHTHFYQGGSNRTYYKILRLQPSVISETMKQDEEEAENLTPAAPATPQRVNLNPFAYTPKSQSETKTNPIQEYTDPFREKIKSDHRKNPGIPFFDLTISDDESDSSCSTSGSISSDDIERITTKRIPFIDEEKIAFCIGYNTFRGSKRIFSKIAKCSALGFNTAKRVKKVRTNANLKDLEKSMRKNKELVYDKSTSTFYYKKYDPACCKALPELKVDPNNSEVTDKFPFTPTSQQSTRAQPSKFSPSPSKTPSKLPSKFAFHPKSTRDNDLPSILNDYFPSPSKPAPKTDVPKSADTKFENTFDLIHPEDDLFEDLFAYFPKPEYSEPLKNESDSLPEKTVDPPKQPELIPAKTLKPSSTIPFAKKPAKTKSSSKSHTTAAVTSSENSLSPTEAQILNIINEVYRDEYGNFFLNLVLMLPRDYDDKKKKITWSYIYRNHMRGKLRNVDNWNLLKRRLIDAKLIEESSTKLIKRLF